MKAPWSERLGALKPWQIDALGLLACALLAALWYAAGYGPLAEARAAREAMQQDIAGKKDESLHQGKVLKAHQSICAQLQAQARAGAVALESPEHLLERIKALTAAANSAALKLDEIKPSPALPGERFTSVPIHLSGSGPFRAMAAFLHGLRATFPDTGVVGFELRGEPEMSEKPVRFSFDLVWYAAPAAGEPKGAPKAEGDSKK